MWQPYTFPTSGYWCRYSLIKSCESGWISSQTFLPEKFNKGVVFQSKYCSLPKENKDMRLEVTMCLSKNWESRINCTFSLTLFIYFVYMSCHTILSITIVKEHQISAQKEHTETCCSKCIHKSWSFKRDGIFKQAPLHWLQVKILYWHAGWSLMGLNIIIHY